MTDHRRAIWFIVLVIVLSLWSAFNTSNNLAAFIAGFFFCALVEVALKYEKETNS